MMARPSGLLFQHFSSGTRCRGGGHSHDASATSRPDGEMVAEPTSPSTWIVASASKLSLSYADLIDFPFFGGSERRSKEEGIVSVQ